MVPLIQNRHKHDRGQKSGCLWGRDWEKAGGEAVGNVLHLEEVEDYMQMYTFVKSHQSWLLRFVHFAVGKLFLNENVHDIFRVVEIKQRCYP